MKLNLDISSADYHAENKHVSSSDLKLLLDDPLRFYMKKYEGVKMEYGNKLAMDLGSYIHAHLLEPHKVSDEFLVFDGAKRGKKYTEFKEANPDKIIISEMADFQSQEIIKAVKDHKHATKFLTGGQAEVSLFGSLEDILVKVRADYLLENAIVDIKTSSSPVDYASFKQTIERYKYNLSAALYVDMFSKHLGRDMDFYFVSICKNPVDVVVYKASKQTLEAGRILYKKALDIFKQCRESGTWEKDLIEEI
jgi:hypothetical protein